MAKLQNYKSLTKTVPDTFCLVTFCLVGGMDFWGATYVRPDDLLDAGFGSPGFNRIRPCALKCNRDSSTIDELNQCISECRKCRKTWDTWLAKEKALGSGWLNALPNCPCWLGLNKFDTCGRKWVWYSVPDGWERDQAMGTAVERQAVRNTLSIWMDVHSGADQCIRTPNKSDKQGKLQATQQCCYKNGKLITGGVGAGTPDRNSPNHWDADVAPWLCAFRLDGKFDKDGLLVLEGGVHLAEYLRRRPPNNGNNCGNYTVPNDGRISSNWDPTTNWSPNDW